MENKLKRCPICNSNHVFINPKGAFCCQNCGYKNSEEDCEIVNYGYDSEELKNYGRKRN